MAPAEAPIPTKPKGPIGDRLDDSVLAHLPSDCQVLSITPSGQSLWAETVRIRVRHSNGRIEELFKKAATGQIGRNMMKGSYEAESALHDAIPGYVPRPVAWGTYSADPQTHFYMCEFVDMLDDVPSARQWGSAVAALHLGSMGNSPDGRFGFQTTTHLANVPVDNTWSRSWEECWTRQMKSLFDEDERRHGPDEEFAKLKAAFLAEVIPRYLRPLETNGRSIQPCLIHSDLWPGNVKPRVDSTDVCLFDPCAYWGHNEADLGICRNPRYRLGPAYMREYWKHVPISQPEQDFDGRNTVYAFKFHLLLSILYYKDRRFRKIATDEMRELVKKVQLEKEELEKEELKKERLKKEELEKEAPEKEEPEKEELEKRELEKGELEKGELEKGELEKGELEKEKLEKGEPEEGDMEEASFKASLCLPIYQTSSSKL
ncbi:Fructosamine kinase-domain-containing protein [Phialemonium atrogriseum]|uniref:protein-ribulosamine 3-kinase n=1 Tax=Phialemonium atrogriseum TaxID=1093897 RepID=A0AAJ0CCS3_9PEZI|nr:Fructosamine kinase-domain-containing protein [Phialemonium atrogriseum]KAK1772834.1 Fructosamine kinase-domain-containing protein [Phialemonium atrogriseum]